jgi:2-polyprenyl-6-methoxyphenol hydroxylase-like FAD-dependent oxidoreductase
MYDVIVVGARVAGSATAMLLARKGYKVLLVDKAAFPSDTMSTHQVQLPAVARLKRWGLLDRVIASNAPAARQVRFDIGPVVLQGKFPEFEGIDALYSPRRYILDKILVDAAVEAGAELHENFIVDEILRDDDRVTGIRGHAKEGQSVAEQARVIVGADGRHSLVAKAVQPEKYHEHPAQSLAYYTYWADVPLSGGEVYGRGPRSIGLWPTNDGLTMSYIAWPVKEFNTFRSNIEANVMSTFDLVPELGQRMRSGRRVEKFVGTADLPSYFRKPYGSGWALVGDAGLVKDPITGQGINAAFRDAELLTEALDRGLSGQQPLTTALAGYEQQRNAAELPIYQFTLELASFAPPALEQQLLFAALQHNQAATDQFFGMFTGAVPMSEFFSPRNLFKIIGALGMLKIMAHNARQPKSKAAQSQITQSSVTVG